MATNVNSSTTYACRHCHAAMAETTAPADRTYVYLECSNPACRWCCACELAAELLAAIAPVLPFEPTPAETSAQRKARYWLAAGIRIVADRRGWLVPSGTRSNVIHRVDHGKQCSCEAGQAGKACWHVAAVELTTEQVAA